jgi:ligand-binding sensor domain-containing protein
MGVRTRRCAELSLLLALASIARSAAALDVGRQPFSTRQWDRTDAVYAIAQGPDGLLWLGSRTGLARFDGERFVEVDLAVPGPPSATPVRRVLVARDGVVWAATGAGELGLAADPQPRALVGHGQLVPGLVRLDPLRPASAPGRLRRFSAADGLPSPWVWALVEDRAGSIWIGTEDGLGRFADGRLERFSTADGLPSPLVTSLAVGPDGALYVGTGAGVVVRRDGRFVATAIHEPVVAIAVDRAGRLWAAAHERVLRADPGGGVKSFAAHRVVALAVDGDDNVWADPSVFVRGEPVPWHGPREFPGRVMLADREGSIWMATREGMLTQLSAPRVRNLGAEEGLPGKMAFSVLGARDGSMYDSTQGGIARHAAGAWTVWRNGSVLGTGPRDIGEGWPGTPNAGVWLASAVLARGGPQGFTVLRRSEELIRKGYVRSVVTARNGDLWVSEEGTIGVLHFRGGDTTRAPVTYRPRDGVCSGGAPTHGLEASDGSIWFAGTYDDEPGSGVTAGLGVTRIKDRRARCYGAADGLPPAAIGTLGQDREGTLWLGTGWGAGLVRFRGERFTSVPASAGLPRANITGIVDDGRDHLWIGSEAGVWRVPKADLHRCADGPCPGVSATVFGKEEGMRTPSARARSIPTWRSTRRATSGWPRCAG